MSRQATTKRKVAEAQINPNALSGYYVGSEIDPGGWTRQKLSKDDWTKDERLLPRYQQTPKKCWLLERHGTYNLNEFISLRGGDFYPGDLILIDFPPVVNQMPITKRTHVKANRIWNIYHRIIQDNRSLSSFMEYTRQTELTENDVEKNLQQCVRKRADIATRDYMVIYAPHDKLLDIIQFLAFDPQFISQNKLPSGALTIFVTFEMQLQLIAKFHPFAIFYYHWKMLTQHDVKLDILQTATGRFRHSADRPSTVLPASDSQGKWVCVEYKRADSEWNQYDVPVDRYDKALGQLTVGIVNETGNICNHFENCMWETTVAYTVETVKAEVLEKEYLPEYMPFNGLERIEQDDGLVLPRDHQTFEPTHGMKPKTTIMSNRGENKFINTRFLLTDIVDGQGKPDPVPRGADRGFYPNYNNTTDMVAMTPANPFSNITGNKEAIFGCMARQLNAALDTTLDQTDVYNENFIIQGEQPAIPRGMTNRYVVLPSRKRSTKSRIQVRAKKYTQSADEILDETATEKLGECNPDGTQVDIEVTTLTDEKITVRINKTIRFTDKTFQIQGHKVIIGDREGEVVVSSVTGKLNKYDMIVALSGIGTEDRPFVVEQNLGYLQKQGYDHSEIGVCVDPHDKQFKYIIVTSESNLRTSNHDILHKLKPGLVIDGEQYQFAFLQYIGAPNEYKGFMLMGENLPGAFKGEFIECLGDTDAIGYPITDHWTGFQQHIVMFEERFQTDEELLEAKVGHYIAAPLNLLKGEVQGEIDTAGNAYLPDKQHDQSNTDKTMIAKLKLATASPKYTRYEGEQTVTRMERNGYINYYFNTDTLKCNLDYNNNTWDFTPIDGDLDLNPNIDEGFTLQEARPINQQEMQHIQYLVMNPSQTDRQIPFLLLYICVPTQNQEGLVITRILKGPGYLTWIEGIGILANIGILSYDIFKYEGITNAGPASQPKAILIEDDKGKCSFINLAYATPTVVDDTGTDQFVVGSILTSYNKYALATVNKRSKRAIFGVLAGLLAPLLSSVVTAGVEWGAQKLFNWIGGKRAVRGTMEHVTDGKQHGMRLQNNATISNVTSKVSLISYRGTVMLYHRYIPVEDPNNDDEAEMVASKDNSLHKCWVDKDDQPLILGEWLQAGGKQWFSYITKPFNQADEDRELANSARAYITLQNPYETNDYVPGLNEAGEHIDTKGNPTITYHQRRDRFYFPNTIQTIDQITVNKDTQFIPELETCMITPHNQGQIPISDIFHGEPQKGEIDVNRDLLHSRRGEIFSLAPTDLLAIQKFKDRLLGIGTNLRLTNPYNSSLIKEGVPNEYSGHHKTSTLKSSHHSTPVYQITASMVDPTHLIYTSIGIHTATNKCVAGKQSGVWLVGDWYQVGLDHLKAKSPLFVIEGPKPTYDTSIQPPQQGDPPPAGFDQAEFDKYMAAKAKITDETVIWRNMTMVIDKLQVPVDEWRQWRVSTLRSPASILATCWDVSTEKQYDIGTQIAHRTVVQYRDAGNVLKTVELMNPVLNFFLEQTYIERQDGLTDGHDPIHALSPQQLDVGTTEQRVFFDVYDVTIGIMNSKTTNKTKMNFITISYLEGASRIHTIQKQSQDGKSKYWTLRIDHPYLTGGETGKQLTETEFLFKGDEHGLTLPIDMQDDEQIRIFGYFNHQILEGASTYVAGKGWCEIISKSTFTKIDGSTMQPASNQN